MTIKTCFTILAVLSFLFGVSFVLSPAQVLSNYGIETSPALALMGRLFGGVLLTPSVILWLAKDFRDEAAVRGGAARCTLRGCRNLVVATWALCRGLESAGVVHGADLPLRRRGSRLLSGGAGITAIGVLNHTQVARPVGSTVAR